MWPLRLLSSPPPVTFIAAAAWPLPSNEGCRPIFSVVEGSGQGWGIRGGIGKGEGM